jgi:uncharacterized protein (UPF0332 family)
MVFPPKKKHTVKPRTEPVTALSDEQRRAQAKDELGLAFTHLAEARILAKGKETPHACVHSAYYAMYHLAIAAILAEGGVGKRKDAPQSHETVIEHFGKLARVKDNGELMLGQSLGRARVDRTVADYGLERRISIKDANDTMADAEDFFEKCAAVFKFAILPKS